MSAIGVAFIGVVGTLFGTILGFFINDYLQNQRQEREWKRQFSAKLLEQVYTKLYLGVNTVIKALELKTRDLHMNTGWGSVQKDSRYIVMRARDDNFRKIMDEFDERTERYEQARSILLHNFIPKVVGDVSEELYGTRLNPRDFQILVTYSYVYGKTTHNPNLLNCLLANLHPTEYTLVGQIDGKALDFTVDISRLTTSLDDAKEIFEKFWERCLTIIKEDKTYQYLEKEDIELLKEAQNVNKLISERIEDAWKV